MSAVNLVFLGDSTSRGVYCSLIRILSGNELEGPLDTLACGGPTHGHFKNSDISFPWYPESFFGGRLTLNICFVTSFVSGGDHLDWKLEWAITQLRPYALVLNTGAWDFDGALRSDPRLKIPLKTAGTEECSSEGERASGRDRAERNVLDALRGSELYANQTADAAAAAGKAVPRVQLIYRNNHYNQRFGVKCADQALEALLSGLGGWAVLDTRRVSEKIYASQMEDGLHIDRRFVHTVQEHRAQHQKSVQEQRPSPGMLQAQIVQNLLNLVFQDALQALYGRQ